MQDKELDDLLKESVQKEKTKEFSEVWGQIKGEVLSQKEIKSIFWKRWVPIALTSVMIIVCVFLSPLLINKPIESENPQEEIFYSDTLEAREAILSETLEGLNQLNISNITSEKYEISETRLYFSEENEVKGAKFAIYTENPMFIYAEIKLYAKDVNLEINLSEIYDTTCIVKTASVYYKFKQESDGIYEFDTYILHNNIQYVMFYMGLSNDLTEFLNYFID